MKTEYRTKGTIENQNLPPARRHDRLRKDPDANIILPPKIIVSKSKLPNKTCRLKAGARIYNVPLFSRAALCRNSQKMQIPFLRVLYAACSSFIQQTHETIFRIHKASCNLQLNP